VILPAPFCWCEIPTGKTKITYTEDSENSFYIPQFFISQFPISTAQYQAFLDDPDGYHDEDWWNYSEAAENWRAANKTPKRATTEPNEPRTQISWYEAIAFCLWLTDHLGLIDQMIMLPTEQQWQRAAQGDDARHFPWGNDFDPELTNTRESYINKPTPVEKYAQGKSPYGVMDMVGNIDEWCMTEYISGKNIMTGSSSRVLRGGTFKSSVRSANCEARGLDGPIGTTPNHGFRVVYTRVLKGL
jgi:formylglycine-generating enzyme required for sulfatase activity